MTDPRNLLIYTDRLLPASETFILNPSQAFSALRPYYIGARRVPGLPLPEDRTMTAHGNGRLGKVRQYASVALTGEMGVHRLAPRLAPLQPMLIQAHYGPSGANAMPLAKALKIPLVVYYHGIDATMTDDYARQSYYNRRYLGQRDRLKAEAALFLTQSAFLKRRLVEQGFPEDKIVVQYVGVRPKQTEIPPLSEREPIVLFVARLVEKKGCDHLIRAVALAQEHAPEMELVIVGDGVERERLEALAAKTLKRYRFIGWQNPEQVMGWMQRARVFSVPSITAQSGDSEGFGMVFAEAQSAGLPVVSYCHGGIPEAVAHEATGLLAPERDVETLADHLARLMTDDALWQQFSERGPGFVRENFDLETLVRRLEALYLERFG